MFEKLLEIIRAGFIVKEMEMSEFATIDKGGAHYQINTYSIEGVGCISTLYMKGMLGLTTTMNLYITPMKVDAPILAYERTNTKGGDTLYLSLFDTRIHDIGDFTKINGVKDKAFDLPTVSPEHGWRSFMEMPATFCKKGKKLDERYDRLVSDFLKAYLEILARAPFCSPTDKRAKNIAFVEGLLGHADPLPDLYKKVLGNNDASKLFRKYIFFSNPELE